jgi:hypothetical protein
LCCYVMETRMEKGEKYPPKSLFNLLTGLLRYMHQNKANAFTILNDKDPNFIHLVNKLQLCLWMYLLKLMKKWTDLLTTLERWKNVCSIHLVSYYSSWQKLFNAMIAQQLLYFGVIHSFYFRWSQEWSAEGARCAWKSLLRWVKYS